MKRIFLTLLLFSISLFAFAGDNPTIRPLAGNFSGTANFLVDGYCDDLTGVPFHTVTETVGKLARHGNKSGAKAPLRGRAAFTTSHCTSPDQMHALYGEAILTAANGHQVFFSYTADTIAPPPLIIQSISLVVTGGTGEFEGASGELAGYVFIKFLGTEVPDWPIEFALAGWIVY